MVTKIQKWGNSLGLRIPKSFAAEANIEAGSEVVANLVGMGQISSLPKITLMERSAASDDGFGQSSVHNSDRFDCDRHSPSCRGTL